MARSAVSRSVRSVALVLRLVGLVVLLQIVLVASAFAQGTDGETRIEPGFVYRDMEFAVMHPYEILGTMINRTGQNYKSACFMMKLYNKSDQLLKTQNFCMYGLADNQSKLFRIVTGVSPVTLK